MKYLKYLQDLRDESSNVDTDEVFEVFQDFIDEFSAIEHGSHTTGNVIYKITDHSWEYTIQIGYWVKDIGRDIDNVSKRDKKSEEIEQYLKNNILARFDSMGIKYYFSHFNNSMVGEIGYEATIQIPKDQS